MNFIKLTTQDGTEILVNPAHIIMVTAHDSGTAIRFLIADERKATMYFEDDYVTVTTKIARA